MVSDKSESSTYTVVKIIVQYQHKLAKTNRPSHNKKKSKIIIMLKDIEYPIFSEINEDVASASFISLHFVNDEELKNMTWVQT